MFSVLCVSIVLVAGGKNDGVTLSAKALRIQKEQSERRERKQEQPSPNLTKKQNGSPSHYSRKN